MPALDPSSLGSSDRRTEDGLLVLERGEGRGGQNEERLTRSRQATPRHTSLTRVFLANVDNCNRFPIARGYRRRSAEMCVMQRIMKDLHNNEVNVMCGDHHDTAGKDSAGSDAHRLSCADLLSCTGKRRLVSKVRALRLDTVDWWEVSEAKVAEFIPRLRGLHSLEVERCLHLVVIDNPLRCSQPQNCTQENVAWLSCHEFDGTTFVRGVSRLESVRIVCNREPNGDREEYAFHTILLKCVGPQLAELVVECRLWHLPASAVAVLQNLQSGEFAQTTQPDFFTKFVELALPLRLLVTFLSSTELYPISAWAGCGQSEDTAISQAPSREGVSSVLIGPAHCNMSYGFI
ncbi:hypothetical protein BDK51DRAFT_30060 [Blyttiomyces helicus]|uniref:Uncharacterized protein n=1 Tax=Blyttiomyces helicus TaxID=388810 RepID=A0A4P9WLJ1_9FUNG|nr:hypothetical protein BDK51DRAFT_30060 [Blyttiomyces helicus]|eukprot:RKO93035.1 hypothetical protein BDK51DRAFT_30060 [Blyttiomyces helicus]